MPMPIPSIWICLLVYWLPPFLRKLSLLLAQILVLPQEVLGSIVPLLEGKGLSPTLPIHLFHGCAHNTHAAAERRPS